MATWNIRTAGDAPVLIVQEAESIILDPNGWYLVDKDGRTVAAFPPTSIQAVWKDQRPLSDPRPNCGGES